MGKVLVLDAGHGINTAGKRTINGSRGVIREWNMNDSVVRKIIDILSEYDVTIYRTDDSTGNKDISLAERVKRCNAYNPHLFVSIHHNAGGGTGTEVFWHTKGTSEDKKVAGIVAPKLASMCSVKNRGVKQAQLGVLTCRATAILVEGGFMDHKSDYELITSDHGQKLYAKAVAESIIEYLSLVKKQPVDQQPIETEAPSDSTDKKWYQVVVGSYLGRNKANEVKAKLESQGYTGVWIDVVKISDKTYYRVICGSYKDRTNANDIKAKLDKFYTGVWINIKK